jgi:hypothetical protein
MTSWTQSITGCAKRVVGVQEHPLRLAREAADGLMPPLEIPEHLNRRAAKAVQALVVFADHRQRTAAVLGELEVQALPEQVGVLTLVHYHHIQLLRELLEPAGAQPVQHRLIQLREVHHQPIRQGLP